MKKSVLSGGFTFALLLFSFLSFSGCYSTVEVSDSSAEKAIAIDWVEPPCAEPGSAAGYIEGNGFGAKNVTITVGGIEAQVLAATGKDASFVVPEGLEPGPIEVVVMNPGGRLATIQWVVCGFDCSAIDCDDGNECTTDTCDPSVEECVHTPVGDGAACDFGGVPGLCIAGVCEEDASCPVLTNVLATPPEANVGDEINVSAEASGVGPIDYLWTATGGSFVDPSLPTTAYLCEEVGQQDLTITISDGSGSCTDATTVTVTCLGSPDLDPPVLTDFDFNPKQIDLSTQSQDVTCTMAATDVGTGITGLSCFFQSPLGGPNWGCGTGTPSSGDEFDGVWSCTVTIPTSSPGGTWSVIRVQSNDEVGNIVRYDTSDLQALGFPTQLDVTSSTGDTDPPVLTDFDFNPKQIDLSTQSQDVTCTMAATDVGTGITGLSCFFQSPLGGPNWGCGTGTPSSGDEFDGVWSCTVTIPTSSPGGTWSVIRVQSNDEVGNIVRYDTSDLQALGFPTQLDVTSSTGDTDPPVLTDFDFNPKQIDLSTQSQDVTCTMAATDVGTGITGLSCFFQSPLGGPNWGCGTGTPSSGDEFDGVWSCTVTIPTSSPGGTWSVIRVQSNDEVGNIVRYDTSDLQALGFPTQLDVTYGGGSPP